jgi:hypothetical protein
VTYCSLEDFHKEGASHQEVEVKVFYVGVEGEVPYPSVHCWVAHQPEAEEYHRSPPVDQAF